MLPAHAIFPSSFALHSARAALRYQFVIDSLDVWLPATNLGFVHLDDGILGFTGHVFLFGSSCSRQADFVEILKYCHIPYGTAKTMAASRRREVSADTSDGGCYLLFILNMMMMYLYFLITGLWSHIN
jgi:hypothetical protein